MPPLHDGGGIIAKQKRKKLHTFIKNTVRYRLSGDKRCTRKICDRVSVLKKSPLRLRVFAFK
jgi:hypothetical protein